MKLEKNHPPKYIDARQISSLSFWVSFNSLKIEFSFKMIHPGAERLEEVFGMGKLLTSQKGH
jgi:hypothetical protein